MNQENQDIMPEDGDNQSQNTPDTKSDIKEKLQQVYAKFRELPPKFQFAIAGGAVLFLYIVFAGGGSTPPAQPKIQQKAVAQQSTGTTRASDVNKEDEDGSFSQIDPERGSLQRGFFEEQRRILADRLGATEEKVDTKMDEMKEIQQSIDAQAKRLSQMVENFNEQMKSMEQINQGSLDEIRKLAEESKNRSINTPGARNGSAYQNGGGLGGSTVTPQSGRNKPIKQIILQQEGNANSLLGDPLLGSIVNGRTQTDLLREQAELELSAAPPFIPPLGFVRGTLINGFDALAGTNTPSPALVRLSGSYKTAMNSTVNLNGCFMLIEFEGDLSTERAFGTPARMTCVYPDQGAVTYDVAGYVVDEKDGIVGVPGIFYEGDPSRLVTSMIADFTSAIAEVITANQSTITSDASGIARSALTGSETKAEIAGGISTAAGGLRDYLAERANRIVPFVRVDATRELHIVILEGVELRHSGKPWTLLVSGETRDSLKIKRERRMLEIRKSQQNNLRGE